jgi:hypothetical protein
MLQTERKNVLVQVPGVDPAGTGLQSAGDGKMWVDQRFAPQLRRAGLAGFEEVMSSATGRCLRELKMRENWYLPVAQSAEVRHGLYLKKHHVRTWMSWLRALLGIGPGTTPARAEVENVRYLTADGIEVMCVVAYGEKLHANGLIESFLLTEELHDYEVLPDFLRRRFPPLTRRQPTARDADLDRLIRRLAEVARRFHRAGYNHRDFYAGHFFVKETTAGEFDIRMIDLQRVQRRRRFRRRWLVKDLSQLAYSLPRDRIKCTHRLAFVRHYLGVQKLCAADHRFIREILMKQQQMERRLGAKP